MPYMEENAVRLAKRSDEAIVPKDILLNDARKTKKCTHELLIFLLYLEIPEPIKSLLMRCGLPSGSRK